MWLAYVDGNLSRQADVKVLTVKWWVTWAFPVNENTLLACAVLYFNRQIILMYNSMKLHQLLLNSSNVITNWR